MLFLLRLLSRIICMYDASPSPNAHERLRLLTLFSFRIIGPHERADRSEPTCVSVDGDAKTDAREQ